MHRSLPISCACALLLIAPGVSAQVIVGRVLDEIAGTGVTAAHMVLVDRNGAARGQALADSAGWFRLVAPIPGEYRVRASSIGYSGLETVHVKLDKGVELQLELRMSSVAIPHEPLRIVARRSYRIGRLAEYYDRAQWNRRTGSGRIFMRDDIERLKPFNVSTLVRMTPSRLGCPMSYMLDGLPVDADIIDSLIRPDEVEGVEIYRGGTQVPIEYMNRSGCGLVLVWTRIDMPGMRPFTWKRLLIGLGLGALIFGLASQMD